jgi:hypothetical protein
VNFKEYVNTNPLSLSADEKKASKMGLNTGNAHHQRLKAGTNLAKKKPYLVAKSHTENKHEHTKITQCIDNPNRPIALSHPEAIDIIQKYKVCPTPQESSKAIKQTGVHLVLVSPKVYILKYKGE